MEPNIIGVTRGVQPLVCNGDDRGQPQPAAFRVSKVAETLPR